MLVQKTYYVLKPFLPRSVQLYLRRKYVRFKLKRCQEVWPIYEACKDPLTGAYQWPGGKKFAFILTHDVDTSRGHERCLLLASLEEKLGFRSSFNFVPERYEVSERLRRKLQEGGFEVGVHGLKHDGKLYQSWETFRRRAARINYYLRDWQAVGFRSPAMHHNLNWIQDLNIIYDSSTFDTDPFEPQPNGVETIFPFYVPRDFGAGGYIELPYTLPQDFTLFILMQEETINIWKQKLEWIARHGGMALLNTHPDYMYFNRGKPGKEEYPVRLYEEFLRYVQSKYQDQYWHVLPREIAEFCLQKVNLQTRAIQPVDVPRQFRTNEKIGDSRDS